MILIDESTQRSRLQLAKYTYTPYVIAVVLLHDRTETSRFNALQVYNAKKNTHTIDPIMVTDKLAQLSTTRAEPAMA